MEPVELPRVEQHELETAGGVGRRIAANVGEAVEVREDVLDFVLVALAADGHVLIEDYPGVGKTALARSLARSIDGAFARIQCTADLLPADVVGAAVFNQREERFEFRPGPIFANVVLVDEINRASPKTQSGLLECMQEQRVTVDVHTHELARPFIVLATQNPMEYAGTYPLPESQVDAGGMLLRAAKARALLEGRDHALPDDVQALAQPVLAHRIVLAPEAAEASGGAVVADAISRAPAL